MKRAFWDQCKGEMKAGNLDTVLARIRELVETLGSFVANPERRASLCGRVDLELIEQEVRAGAFDVGSLTVVCESIIAILADLESPYQHARTQRWYTEFGSTAGEFPDRVVAALSFFFAQTDALRAEVNNVYISMVPLSERQASERKAFKAMIDRGVVTLDVAKAWVRSSAEAVGPGRGPVFLRRAVGRLVVQSLGSSIVTARPLQMEDIPEPLRLDVAALVQFQSDVQHVVLLAAIATFSASLAVFPQGNVELLRVAFGAISGALRDPQVTQESFRTALEREVAALWAAAKEPMNYGAFDQFLAQVKKCFVVDSPVMRVFTQRVAAVLTAPTVDSQVLGTTPWTLRFAEEALLDLRGSMHAFADAHGEVYWDDFYAPLL